MQCKVKEVARWKQRNLLKQSPSSQLKTRGYSGCKSISWLQYCLQMREPALSGSIPRQDDQYDQDPQTWSTSTMSHCLALVSCLLLSTTPALATYDSYQGEV